ncbi:hypothetical protein AYK26_00840 [Euryarchaeota archaeon SM23-78]|nr:MAG: hypothetical protein AYK26_00840 [Euryarchaeota archaeon SM23-78]
MTNKNLKLEEKIRILFNAFNTESKAFIDGFLLENDKYLTATDLYYKSIELVGPDFTPGGKNPRNGNRTIQNHLKHKLPKAKLQYLVEEREHPLKWRRSFEFIPNHDDIARFFLYQSAIKFNMSLFSWLGKSQADGPYTNVKILDLVVKDHVNTTDGLRKRLGLATSTIISKLRKLEECNLLTLSTFYSDTGKGNIKFRWNRRGKRRITVNGTIYKHPLLIQKIVDITQPNPKVWYSAEDLRRRLKEIYSEDYNFHSIRQSLRVLERKNILVCNENWMSTGKLSDIESTTRGEKFYKEVIARVVSFLKYGKQRDLNYIRRKMIYEKNLSHSLDHYHDVAMHTRGL